MKTAIYAPEWKEEVTDLIEVMKEKGQTDKMIREIVTEVYGTKSGVKDVLDEQLGK